jgi:Glycosyl hydrolase family 71
LTITLKGTPMLPFAMPSADVFFAAKRKVFAHYFYTFPVSIDNKPAATDYYNTQFLAPGGENGKHAAYGGYLRARPLGVPPGGANWQQLNMQAEISTAIARGITGFTFDVLSLADALAPAGHLQQLLLAAAAVDARFVIVPMLDMSSLTGLTPVQGASIIQTIAASPSLYRLADGRIVFAAFNAPLQPLAWWQQMISTLNDGAIDVAFIPVALGAPADAGVLTPLSYGVGGWGTAIPAAAAALSAASAHTAGLVCMMPILPQQFRPKSSIFWECSGSTTFRNGWMAAINTGADIVQLITWSDFSESGQMQPYTDATLAPAMGTGFYDLNAYYATWFVTGMQPALTQDVLYWFHRRMRSTVAHPNQPNSFTAVGPAEESTIELLAFLTLPGIVAINNVLGAAPAGITSFRQPTVPGNPQFKLMRNGSNVKTATSPVTIYGPAGAPSGLLDLTYWSGSF